MNPYHHSHQNTERPWTAIVSLFFTTLSFLMLVLIIGVSLFRSMIFYQLMCSFPLTWHINEDGTTVILLAPVYLPLLLALIFALIARQSSRISRVVVLSGILALGILLSAVMLPFLLFLTAACFG